MRTFAPLEGGAPRTSARESWPIFLVGCHRSGTTLARYILDAHPRIACPPESKFLAAIPAFLNYPQVPQALDSLGYSIDDTLLAFGRLTAEILGEFAQQRGKVRWIDKTPNYHSILGMIDRMFDRRCLFLLMVRHPLDTIQSLEESRFFTVEKPRDPDIARIPFARRQTRDGWLDYWLTVNNNLLTWTDACQERCKIVRYEDLVSTPELQIRRILEFIGEPYVEGLPVLAFSRRPADGYQDDKIRATDAVHSGSVGKWMSWRCGEAADLWSRASSVATRLGYSLDRDTLGSCVAPADVGRSGEQERRGDG